jgi:membrane-bound lytic murein transglycosylase A
MLVPKSLDPVARGHKLPLPDVRPSAKIAKLFPQVAPKEAAQDRSKDQKAATAAAAPATNATPTPPTAAVAQNTPAAPGVPLPAARPKIDEDKGANLRHRRRHRTYRR